MSSYQDFYKPRRLNRCEKAHHLSAGLQPRILLLKSLDGASWDLITCTPRHYMMGGAYLWKQHGSVENEETGSKLPVFGQPQALDLSFPYPFHGDDTKVVQYISGGILAILSREGETEFDESEQLSERFGANLIDTGIHSFRACKVEIRDLDGDGLPDLVIGENDWNQYWPDGAHWGDANYKPFDNEGNWRGGRLNGHVYFMKNLGEDPDDPDLYKYAEPKQIENINQYGFCTPVIADFTGDGLEDMICGDFINNLTFYKRIDNVHSDIPYFEPGVPLLTADGKVRKTRGVINYLIGRDVTGNGLVDIIFGSENGHVTILENLGEQSKKNGSPLFAGDFFVLQTDPPLKADVLPVPACHPLRNGDLDMVSGSAGGFFYIFKDVLGRASGGILKGIDRVLPPDPSKGSIQGPSEIGWGYTCPTLFDWNGNGRLDIIFSDINGEHQVAMNRGIVDGQVCFEKPFKLLNGDAGKPLVTAWRVRPAVDRINDRMIVYYCLDEHGLLSRYEKTGSRTVGNKMLVGVKGVKPVRFTIRHGGSVGRVKLQLFDWTGNGVKDLLISLPKGHDFSTIKGIEGLVHFPNATIAIMQNSGTNAKPAFEPPRYLVHAELGKPLGFGHHSCAAYAFEWKGKIYLIVGAEDGHFYLFNRNEFID
ncbi:MAG: hypothetical protein ACTSXP_15740 [Promethearchaeota archaeon]